MRKSILMSALAGGLSLAAGAAEAGDVLQVANGDELVAAIDAANSDNSIQSIVCVDKGGCSVTGTLPAYTGTHPLFIDGKYSTIDATGIADTHAFASVGGGALTLKRLRILGGKSGVYVHVPADRLGSQRVVLQQVTVRDAAQAGVNIDDHDYSLAGVRLFLLNSKFINNGFGDGNKEGVRVYETSRGRIKATVANSIFRGNAADGLWLNERGGGGVFAEITDSEFVANGPNPHNVANPEDGLDVDERGPGDVWLTVANSHFDKNYDDGIDADEGQSGSIYANLDGITATLNGDNGLTFEEGLNGDAYIDVTDSVVVDNEDRYGVDLVGIESGNGTGTVNLTGVTIGDMYISGMTTVVNP